MWQPDADVAQAANADSTQSSCLTICHAAVRLQHVQCCSLARSAYLTSKNFAGSVHLHIVVSMTKASERLHLTKSWGQEVQ